MDFKHSLLACRQEEKQMNLYLEGGFEGAGGGEGLASKLTMTVARNYGWKSYMHKLFQFPFRHNHVVVRG